MYKRQEIEAEISNMEADEKELFLADMGLTESGLDRLIRESYALLGLISYLTAGPQETRAVSYTHLKMIFHLNIRNCIEIFLRYHNLLIATKQILKGISFNVQYFVNRQERFNVSVLKIVKQFLLCYNNLATNTKLKF